jgi:uncharacterized protein involved in outer membrane biogenesis
MRRILRVSLLFLVLIAAIGAAVAWYLLHDEDFLKARLSAFVLDRTGRELTVDGALSLDLGRQTTIEAHGIRFENAPWASPSDMVALGHLRTTIDVPSLFGDVPVIRSLLLEDCSVHLVENEAGEANWDVLPETVDEPAAEREPAAGLPVALLDTQLRNCRLSHDAPERKQPLTVVVDELAMQLVDGNRWQGSGSGRIDQDPLTFTARMEPASALLNGQPLQYELELQAGEVVLRSSGSVQDPKTGRGADLDFKFSGPEMARVLERLKLPALSEGEFDFRLNLDSEDSVTQLRVDGDLGSLIVNASGQLDRLLRPQAGALRMAMSGPNLEALGQALKISDLVPESFDLNAELSMENGIARAETLVLETARDRLEVSGLLGPAPTFPDSDLSIRATTDEIGRWETRTRLPEATVGPAALSGALKSDGNGLFSVQARLEYVDSTLDVDGKLGAMGSAFEPELNVALESPDSQALGIRFGVEGLPAAAAHVKGRVGYARRMLALHSVQASLGDHRAAFEGVANPVPPFTGSAVDVRLDSPDAAALGRLLGQEALPAAPLTLQGRVSRPDERLRFEDVDLDLAGNRLHANGYLGPDREFKGSEFELELDSPDVAALAALFGTEDLPHEAMKLSMSLKKDGEGIAFRTSGGSTGEITLQIDGRMADLNKPLEVDANFDIRLPSLAFLGFLAPNADLPDRPFHARGKLINDRARTRLDGVTLALGGMTAGVTGEFTGGRQFDLRLDIDAPDASELRPWAGKWLQPEPLAIATQIRGSPESFELAGIDMRLGRSRCTGELRVELGERDRVSGQLTFPMLDLSFWRAVYGNRAAAEPSPAPQYLFDDTPIMKIADLGVDVDLGLELAEVDLGNSRAQDLKLSFLLDHESFQADLFSYQGPSGGRLSGQISLDSSGLMPQLHLELTGREIRLGVATAPGQDFATFPPHDVDILLDGSGETRREMASRLSGEIRAFTGAGDVATSGVEFLLNDVLTELFTTLNPFAEKSEYTRLECAVIAATVLDGRAEVYPVIFNTRELTILSKGTIDLHTEKVDMSFSSKPRQGLGISASVIINPLIKVGGTLASPAIELDPARAAVSGGTAVATAGLSILAKSFADRFLSSKDPCGDARKEIDSRDP